MLRDQIPEYQKPARKEKSSLTLMFQIAGGIVLAIVILALAQCTATIGGLSLLGMAAKEASQEIKEQNRNVIRVMEEQRRKNLARIEEQNRNAAKEMEEQRRKSLARIEEQRRINQEATWASEKERRRAAEEQVEREKTKNKAWNEFYKPSPECSKQNPKWEELVKCSNHKIRQKTLFDEQWNKQ